MNDLYLTYLKKKEGYDNKDSLLLRAAADFLQRQVGEILNDFSEKLIVDHITNINFHYVVVVPTEWELGIREDMLRPIFINANVISKNDQSNRLQFFTKLESIVQIIQYPRYLCDDHYIKKKGIKNGRQYRMCDVEFTSGEKISLSLSEFEAIYSLSALKDATLVSRLSKSRHLKADFSNLKSSLETFLISRIFAERNSYLEKSQ